jgi:hypothetical protein
VVDGETDCENVNIFQDARERLQLADALCLQKVDRFSTTIRADVAVTHASIPAFGLLPPS